MNKGSVALAMMTTLAHTMNVRPSDRYERPGGPRGRRAAPRTNPEENKYRKERSKKNKAKKQSRRKNR